jgi:hypothetical protein
MEWIEEWLHVSPDGGNGTLELLFLLVPIVSWLAAKPLLRLGRRRPSELEEERDNGPPSDEH